MDELICLCMSVSKETIIEAIKNGAKTVEDVQAATGAGTACGGCIPKIEQLLKEYA